MSNVPNPDPTLQSASDRKIHQSSDPLPPPIMQTEPPAHDPSLEGRLGRTSIPTQERPVGVQPAHEHGHALGGHESQAMPTGRTSGAALGGRETQAMPMGRASGAALGGHESQGLPTTKPSTTDKMIGKTEKVLGKMSKNPEMQEKGELRETGGKAAVTGQYRGPHD